MDSLNTNAPSFYEIVMQDRLQDMIYQAISFSIQVMIERVPAFVNFRYLNQELASLVCSVIDGYYLIKTKATFSENFYSICRDHSGPKSILGYLFLHYALPLILSSPSLFNIYNLLKGASMSCFLYLNFPFFSPEYFLLKQKLVRQNKQVSMSYLFLSFIAVLKLLQIFYTTPSKKPSSNHSGQVIPPPYTESSIPSGICGICREKWVNPTALTSSGYIYCYSCIRNHLGIFHACPITNTKSSLRNLRKIHI